MSEYIERSYLMGKLTSSEMQSKMKGMDGGEAYGLFLSMLNEAPAADVVEVKHGRWHWADDGHCKCSVCGQYAVVKRVVVKTNYCPNCGAKMDGGDK